MSSLGEARGPVIKNHQHMIDAAFKILQQNANRWPWLEGFEDSNLQDLAKIVASALWKQQIKDNRARKRLKFPETLMGEGNLADYMPAQSRLYSSLVEPSGVSKMSKAVREFKAALEKASAYTPQGEQFYNIMQEHWAHVTFNEEKGSGSVRAGTLGMVTWNESGNDPAVIVQIEKFPRMKGDAESIAKALEALAKVLDTVD